MDKPVSVRPSGLLRAMLCPGSPRAEQPYPWTDSPAALHGRAMHDAMALLMVTGDNPTGWEKVFKHPNLTDQDVDVLHDTLMQGLALVPDDPGARVFLEHKLDLKFLGLDNGKPDAFFLSPHFRGAVLIDWKFGAGPVEDPEANPQLLAYALGIIENFRAKPHNMELESVEGVIVQPSAWKAEDKVRSHVWDLKSLKDAGARIEAAVTAAKLPGAPRVPGPDQCRWCKAKDDCAEFKAWKGTQDELKAQAEATALATVTQGTPVEAVSDMPLQSPVVVVSAEVIARMEGLLETAKGIQVTDDPTAQVAGKLSKEIRGQVNLIDKNREQVKKPFLEMGRLIDAAANKAKEPGISAATLLDNQVRNWNLERQQEAERARAEQERQRREAERVAEEARRKEEAKAREAADAARRAAEANVVAQNAASEADRRAAQARAEEEVAKAKAAADEADRQARLRAQAAADQEAADRRAKEAQEAAAARVPGYRQIEEVSWEIPDFSKVPVAMLAVVLMPNAKVIDQMVKTKALGEKDAAWLKITRKAGMARSR